MKYSFNYQKIWAFLLSAVLLLSNINGLFNDLKVFADDSHNINLVFLDNNNKDSSGTPLEVVPGRRYVETEVSTLSYLTVSGTHDELINPWLVIRLPKSNMIKNLKFSESESAYQNLAATDETYNYWICKYKNISNGSKIGITTTFRFDKTTAVDGTEFLLETFLMDMNFVVASEDQNRDDEAFLLEKFKAGKIHKQNSIKFIAEITTYKLREPVVTPYKGTYDWYDYAYNSYDINKEKGEKRTVFFKDVNKGMTNIGDEPYIINLNSFLKAADNWDTYQNSKIRYPEKLTIKYQLPPQTESGMIDFKNEYASYNLPWRYDAGSNSVIGEFTAADIKKRIRAEWYGTGAMFLCNLGFTKWPFADRSHISTTLDNMITIPTTYTLDYGNNEIEEYTDRKANIQFIKKEFEPTGELITWKEGLQDRYAQWTPQVFGKDNAHYCDQEFTVHNGKIYDKYKDHTDFGITYFGKVKNINNGTGVALPENGKRSTVTKIEDVILDPNDNGDNKRGLYYESFKLAQLENVSTSGQSAEYKAKHLAELKAELNGSNRLYGIVYDGDDDDSNDVKELIAENIKFGQEVLIQDKSLKYTKLLLEYDQPLHFDNSWISYYIRTKLSPAEAVKFDNGVYTGRVRYIGKTNVFVINDENKEKRVNNDSSWVPSQLWHNDIYPVSPRANIAISGSQTVNYSKKGTVAEFNTSDNINYGLWGPLSEESFSVKHIIVLPPFFDFKKYDNNQYFRNLSRYNSGLTVNSVERVENFKNTGRTALIINVDGYKQALETNRDTLFYFLADINPRANKGDNIIDYYTVYDNKLMKPENQNKAYTDTLDLDEDGDYDEIFMHDKITINYIPSVDVIVTKKVGLDTSLERMSSIVTADKGSDFYYNIEFLNNALDPVNQIYAIDVLPYIGDHNIVADENGNYKPRLTQFPITLSDFIENLPENNEVMKRFEVWYQTSEQGADLESVRDGQWLKKDQITDVASIKSFKINLQSGQQIFKNEKLSVLVKAKMPVQIAAPVGSLSLNSVANSNTNVLYTEANTVAVGYTEYYLQGILFDDYDDNGLKRDDEDGKEGYKVVLINEDTGKEHVDFEGNKYETMTDKDGKYQFKIYKRGNYSVRFYKKNHDEQFSSVANDDTVGSAAEKRVDNTNNIVSKEDEYGQTKTVSLTADRPRGILNASIITNGRSISVKKVSSEKNTDNSDKVLHGAKFALFQDGKQKYEAISDDSGIAKFTDVPFGEYILKEVEAPTGYELNTTEYPLSVSKTDMKTIVVTDKPIKADVILKKVDADDNSKVLAGVSFELTQGDEIKYTADTNNDGVAIFSQVPYGNYQLVEKSTLESYVLLTKPIEVSVLASTAVDLGLITNSRIKADVTLKKVDTDTGAVLAGVTFELQQDGVMKYTATTDTQGIATFNNVLYGTYKLVEKTAKDGYLPWTEDKTVEVNSFKTVDVGTISNTPIKADVKLKKVDADTGAVLAGAKFVLKQNGIIKYEASSQADGSLVFKNVRYGRYKLQEIEAPTGYNLNETEIDVEVKENAKTVDIGKIPDTVIKSTIKLKKVDADTNEALSGVSFSLFKDDKLLLEKTTDDNGELIFEELPLGTYKVEEKAPKDESYLPLTEIVGDNIVIDKNQDIDLGTILNYKKKSDIRFLKVDFDDQNLALSGVKFVLKQNEKILYTAVSDENGLVLFKDIPYGEYILEETDNPVNYELISLNKPVTVDGTTPTIDLGKISNTKIKGTVKLVKVDAFDFDKKLSNVSFVLKQNGQEVYTAKSNSHGEVIFNDVLYGDYVLEEKYTLQGYILSPHKINVEVRESKIYDLGNFKNYEEPGTVPPPLEQQLYKKLNPPQDKDNQPNTGNLDRSFAQIIILLACILSLLLSIGRYNLRKNN